MNDSEREERMGRKALGSSRERLIKHMASSFSRNEEISILPGYKKDSMSMLPKPTIKLRGAISQEMRAKEARHSRFGSSPRLNAKLSESLVYNNQINHKDEYSVLDKDLEKEKNNRIVTQNNYKRELDAQIQKRNDIRDHNESSIKHKLCELEDQNLSNEDVVNTGFLPSWFPPENTKERGIEQYQSNHVSLQISEPSTPLSFEEETSSSFSSPTVDLQKPLLKVHVSQTAAQRPAEKLLKNEYKTQLHKQIEERKRCEDERIAKEREEEGRLQQKIEEEQQKMKLEYDAEQLRQKKREEELNQRKELILKQNAELRKQEEVERARQREKRRASVCNLSSLPGEAGDSLQNNSENSTLVVTPDPSNIENEIIISYVSPLQKNKLCDPHSCLPHFEQSPDTRNYDSRKNAISSRKPIKPTPTPTQSLHLLSDFKRILLEEAARMEAVITDRSSNL